MRSSLLAVVVVSVLCGTAAVAAPQDRPASVPEFGSGVEVVAVPVFVTDGNGRAVGGLEAKDFEVTEEGKAVTVVGFHEIDAARPDLLPQGRAALIARRQFLILFDLSFSSPAGIVRSRSAAIDFVRTRLQPGDLASVGTFSLNRGLQLLVGFTTDRQQLESAIATLGLLDVDRRGDRLNLVYNTVSADLPMSTLVDGGSDKREVREAALKDELRELVVRVKKGETEMYKQSVGTLVDAFAQLGAALRRIQGRTQVIYLSGGFDEALLVGAQGDDAARNSTAVIEGRLWEVDSSAHFGATEVRQQLDRAMKSLATSDAVVHSIDVGGLAATAGDVASVERDAGRSGEESLSQIAHLSGGRFVRATNDVGRGLDEILRATERYYLLAFEARSARKAGAFHKLRVKVRGRDYDISHRPGYYEPDPQPKGKEKPLWLAEQLAAAEAITKGALQSGAGELDLEILSMPYRDTEGNVFLAVVVEMPGKALLQDRRDTVPLEVYGYAFDPQGKVADFMTVAATLDVEKVRARLQGRGVQAHAVFTLPPGRYNLRFLVKDASSGRTGVRFADVQVPAFAEKLLLYPAVLMDAPAEWVILAVKSQNTKAAGANPFRVQETFFTPHVDAFLKNGRTDRIFVMAYTGGVTYGEGAAFQIGASLLDNSGSAVRLGKLQLAQQVAETDGFRRFVLNVTPENVPRGDYRLLFKLTDPTTGAVHSAERPVRFE